MTLDPPPTRDKSLWLLCLRFFDYFLNVGCILGLLVHILQSSDPSQLSLPQFGPYKSMLVCLSSFVEPCWAMIGCSSLKKYSYGIGSTCRKLKTVLGVCSSNTKQGKHVIKFEGLGYRILNFCWRQQGPAPPPPPSSATVSIWKPLPPPSAADVICERSQR